MANDTMLAPNTAFQLTRAAWRSTRSSAFWQVEAIDGWDERRGQLNATVGRRKFKLSAIKCLAPITRMYRCGIIERSLIC